MKNLYRPIQVKFRVTDLERQKIRDRMKECWINNMARYLRTMAINGCIIKPDHTDIKQTNYELHKIGVYTSIRLPRRQTRPAVSMPQI